MGRRAAICWAGAWLCLQGAPKPLTIERVVLSQYEDGPAVARNYVFLPGETIFLSFHVNGYRPIGDEGPRVSLTYVVEAVDAAGTAIIPLQEGKVDTELDPEDKNWTPKVRASIAIPPHAPTGEYTIRMAVNDRVGATQARASTSFHVKGESVELSDKLVVREFHFYRGEEDRIPLAPAAYHAGDTLWAKFVIAGYRLGEKNAFEVGYGLAVLRPDGEQLFRQADAAMEKQESFYPRRSLPAGLSLNLDKDLKPGEYTLVVLVSDKTGNQTAESRHAFRVE